MKSLAVTSEAVQKDFQKKILLSLKPSDNFLYNWLLDLIVLKKLLCHLKMMK